MKSLKGLKAHWFTVALYIGFSLFFLVAGILSATTYSHVVGAQRDVYLSDPSFEAQVLGNGSVRITFQITLVNPSRYELHISSSVWSTMVVNQTDASPRNIPIQTVYTGPTAYVTVPAESSHLFSYEITASSPDTLSNLMGFVNYSASNGQSYTLETLPYDHEFSVSAWMGGFEHNYLRESYLNDIVTVDLRYSSAPEAGA